MMQQFTAVKVSRRFQVWAKIFGYIKTLIMLLHGLHHLLIFLLQSKMQQATLGTSAATVKLIWHITNISNCLQTVRSSYQFSLIRTGLKMLGPGIWLIHFLNFMHKELFLLFKKIRISVNSYKLEC